MSFFQEMTPPKTSLGVYRVLSAKAGVRVSPLCLGGMSLGDTWNGFMGSMDKDQSIKLLDAFYESGGNFIDTACNYQDEQSESIIGEWMENRGNRDEMIIATKFTTNYRSYKYRGTERIAVNFGGNSTKSLHVSVHDSLKKLRTDYIDILYVHWWDYTTSVEELMHALDNIVKSGKVLYLGVSDVPAWIVASANRYARDHGLAQFVVYQGQWNIMLRDFEREIIPLCKYEGMALAPWGTLGSGRFQTKKQIEARKAANEGIRHSTEQTEQELKISAALEKVAEEIGEDVSITAVALAYVLQKTTYVFPIVGGRKVEHLKDNIKALEINLTEKQIEYLESQTSFDPGFPHSIFGADPRVKGGKATFIGMKNAGTLKFVRDSQPIPGETLN